MEKIAIIKLGAKGDVVRTLALLPAIKKKHPESELIWITKSNIADILENHPLIKEIHSLPYNGLEEFDFVYNFDTEEDATSLAKELKAPKKLGFYSEDGFPMAFNSGAEYYLNTMFDDQLKKENKKTYQQMMLEAGELPETNEIPRIYLTEKDKKYAEEFAEKNSLKDKKIIGIHMGSGPRWPSKAWSEKQLKEFINLTEGKYEIILFGGPDEIERHKNFSKDVKVHHNNPHNTNREFAALLNLCDLVVCSDSFAVHVATALNKKVIALFFCTSFNEVEPYNLIKKIASPMLYEFFPEKSDQYSEELTNSIKAEEVFKNIK